MKLTNLKYLLLLGLFIFAGACTETNAQLKLRFATDVRYIAGGFMNKRPSYNNLLSALNDIKALATSERPYTFWVMSDTVNIYDWDSVYQTGGLSMKDSIDVHYVAVGKIKWAGFGFGGSGGGGITAITPPENTTTHYSFWTWTGQSGIGSWQTRLGENADSIDQRIWELIVYTDSLYLYIENDTLKLRSSTITALVEAAGTRPDTTIIMYNSQDEVITGNYTVDGDMGIGSGSLRLASANNNTGVSRVIWSGTNKPYWSGSGAIGDSSQFVLYDIDTGLLELDSLLTWQNLNQTVKDSLTEKWYIDFYGNSNPAHNEGRVFYDSTHKTLSIYNDESDVTLNVGSELYIRIYNPSTTDTIFNGYPVYPMGVFGDETGSVAIAQADSDATSNVIGVATHDIEPETFGYISRFGYVHDINTTGFTPGGTVYLSADTAGYLTTVKPGAPNNVIPLGGVTKVHASAGSVFLIMDRFNPINGEVSIGFIDSSYVIDLAVGVPLQITNEDNNLFISDADIAHDITLSGDTLYLAEVGVYNIMVAFSFQGANGGIYKFTAKENGTFVGRAGRRYTSTADVGNVYFNFAVATAITDEIITFWVENTAGSQDATMIDGSVIVTQVR